MEWPPQGWAPIAASTVLVGLTVAGLSWHVTVRRRRLHTTLIREAVARMSACLREPPSRMACLHRDRVAAIVARQALAERIERDIRPRVPGPRQSPGSATAVVVAELDTIVHTLTNGQESLVSEEESGGPVPILDSPTRLGDLHAAMAATVATRIRHLNVVLRHAMDLRVIDPPAGQRLAEAIAVVADAGRESDELAGEGRLMAALCALTRFDLPVPEDGVPGEATRRELARQADRLAEIADAHRVELLVWCTNALRHCGMPERKEPMAL
jgi:hypothetical protein